jgi:demethylmenaquinone methyltransferase/2-methoxy-6-polyprenyl-1,4-benzoquinol methylase
MGYAQEKVMPYGNKTPKGKQVERMFDNIAPHYDLLNHLMSFGIDRGWRRKTIDSMKAFPHADILDVATGTGDFAMLACRRLGHCRVTATDLSEKMMEIGRQKVERAGLASRISFRREDCMALSFADGTFDVVTVAYGVRNFQDLDRGLAEMRRVLRPGGHAVILELCTPRRFPMRQLFRFYAHVVMPAVGRLVSKDRRAYTYLPASMEAFPQGEVMQQILTRAGFSEVKFKRFTFGLSTMYLAKK